VWKRVQRLKELGYVIEGSPRRGYRLLAAPDKLLPAEVLAGLATRRFRGPVHHFAELPSTNDLAKELGARQAPEGTLVLAERQTQGRGRLGREWDSPAGAGVYASLLLRPKLPPWDLPQITLTTAVAVVRAVSRAAGLALGIKWPNDLLIQGRKVGGILTEMETEADRIRYLVVGLGLNVNNAAFPPELADAATSLYLAAGRPFDRVRLLQAWLTEMEDLYAGFLAGEFAAILDEWRRHAVTLGREVAVRQGARVIRGQAVDVAPDGALLILTPEGETVRVTSGEIAPGPGAGPGG
jgi:BirA family biotin operon repressor/biotin-[acetyl-CoA-carboxylase] ligase